MSDNSYKGISGGDPKRRAEHFKSLVLIAYICPSCKQEKSEKFPAGKDLTGRVCVDCRRLESIRKQEEQKEANEKAWAEKQNAPIRTEAEKLALMKEWAHAPQERCACCGEKFFVADPDMPFYNDDFYRPNAIRTGSYRNNPYEYEIHGEEHPKWRCGKCYVELEEDI